MATTYSVDLQFRTKGQRDLERLKGSTNKLDQAARKAQGSFNDAANGITKTGRAAQSAQAGMRGLIGVVGRLAAAYGALRLAQSTAQAGIQRAESERRIRFLAREYGEANALQREAAAAAEKFGESQTVANKALADTYARLRPIGTSLSDIVSVYNGFNTAARISGSSAVEASNAFRQLSQALGSGALRGDEFNSIAEQVPGVLTAISKETGIAQGKLRDYAAEGKITADVVIRALKRIERDGADQLAEALNGPEQAIKDLQIAGEELQVAFAETIIPEIATAFRELAVVIKELEGPLRFIGGLLGNTLKEARLTIQAIKGQGDAINTLRAGKLPFFGAPGANEQLEGFFGKERLKQLKDDARKAADALGISYSEALKRRLTAALKVIDATPEIRKRIEKRIQDEANAAKTGTKDTFGTKELKGGSALQELLRRIRSGEGSYTSINRGRAGDTPGGLSSLTSMSIAEVMRQQQAGNIFAAGAYQFIPETLKGAVQRSGIDPNARFSPANQDKLAIELILGGSKRPMLTAYLKGQGGTLDQAQAAASNEWAALLGPNGKGAYDGDSAGNKGSISIRDLLPLVKQEISGGGGAAADQLAEDQFRAQQRLNEAAKSRAETERALNEQKLEGLQSSEAALALSEDQLFISESKSRLERLNRELAGDELRLALDVQEQMKAALSDKEKENIAQTEQNRLLELRNKYEKDRQAIIAETVKGGFDLGAKIDGQLNEGLNRTQELAGSISDTLEGGIVGGLNAAIDALITGADDLDERLKKIAQGVLADIGQQLIKAGISSLFKSIGGGAPGGLFAGLFADGGTIPSGQFGIVGEAGPELAVSNGSGTDIIPMQQAMARYSPTNNSSRSGGADGSDDGSSAGGSNSLQISYDVISVNEMRVVTEDQFVAGLDAAAKRGAAAGTAQTMRTLQNSRSQRAKLGMR
jgi:tape measure domain-containing protein